MVDYVEKITVRAWECSADDIEKLRGHGYSHRDVMDIIYVSAYFNYINRVVDALGAERE